MLRIWLSSVSRIKPDILIGLAARRLGAPPRCLRHARLHSRTAAAAAGGAGPAVAAAVANFLSSLPPSQELLFGELSQRWKAWPESVHHVTIARHGAVSGEVTLHASIAAHRQNGCPRTEIKAKGCWWCACLTPPRIGTRRVDSRTSRTAS